jgi:membrane protein
VAYHSAGSRWGTATLKFYDRRDNLVAVFSVIFSNMIISNNQKYGPIGVVFGLMSLFIAIGVVIILGAAVGLMWQDRGLSFRAAVRKPRRPS